MDLANTILVADEDLWSFRQVLQEAWREEARFIPAWPLALAMDLARRLQPQWVFFAAEGRKSMEDCRRVRQAAPHARLAAVGGETSASLAFELARLGVEGYWAKPLTVQMVQKGVETLAASGRDEGAPKAEVEPPVLIGEDPALHRVRYLVERVAATDATVLLRGESGSGKEVVATLIHRLSCRRRAPLVKLNCAAIPSELLESELFGYEPGAFTGAAKKKAGKFELAHRGTILLDEISELHPHLQAKLLHILQDGNFSRLGAEANVTVEARVLAASNADLEAAVASGRFRADLFYRLNVVCIRLPPLRERPADIPLLFDFIRAKHAAHYGKDAPPLSPLGLTRLQQYPWPGNVRELENFVKRFLILGSEAQALEELLVPAKLGMAALRENLAAPAWPVPVLASNGSLSLLQIGRQAAREAERAAMLNALDQAHWNRRQAARMLKISYKALHNKLREMKQDVDFAMPSPNERFLASRVPPRPWPAGEAAKAQAAG